MIKKPYIYPDCPMCLEYTDANCCTECEEYLICESPCDRVCNAYIDIKQEDTKNE